MKGGGKKGIIQNISGNFLLRRKELVGVLAGSVRGKRERSKM